MKEIEKRLPSITSVVLIVILSIVMRLTVFASATDLDWYENDKEATEFTITDEAGLRGLSQLVNEGEDFVDKTIVLADDIVLASDFTPVGTATVHFSGTFDGKGNTISTESGVVIGDINECYQGLFGSTLNASIKNLTMDATVVGKGTVGAIVGCFYANDSEIATTMENCVNLGTVTSTAKDGGNVGGLIGSAEINRTGTFLMIDCYNEGAVKSEDTNVGGLIGNMYQNRTATAEVEYCYNTGSVEGSAIVGGLVGLNNSSSIGDSYNTGAVVGSAIVGGLVGGHLYDNVTPFLESSYNIGNVEGTEQVGGVVGINKKGAVNDCYYNSETVGDVVTQGIGDDNNDQVTTALVTQEMTGTGAGRADETMVGLASSVWNFVADGNGMSPYPTLSNNEQTPPPHVEYIDYTSRNSKTSTFYIKVNTNNGGSVSPDGGADHMQEVKRSTDIEFAIQAEEGFVIADVLVNGKSVGAVKSCNFTNVHSHQTLEVVFEKATESALATETQKEDTRVELETAALPFGDVNEADDNYAGIAYVYENGIMAGVSADVFGGELSITRGMIGAILHRMDGSEAVDGDMPFVDIAADKYYTEAVRWGRHKGVMAGINSAEFAPNISITNEQFVAFLYRYASHLDMDMTIEGDWDLSDCVVGNYARTAIVWALENNIIEMTDLEPKAKALRGNVAISLMRFMEMM